MFLQPASRKEITRIAIGTLFWDVILVAALFLLGQFGIGEFDLARILFSAACGSLIAVLNFTALCITVQNVVSTENKKQMQAKFQVSYNFRMLLQGVWVVVALLLPQIHVVAGALPLLFPNLTIFALQATGRLMPKDEQASPAEAVSEDGASAEEGSDGETTEIAPGDESSDISPHNMKE